MIDLIIVLTIIFKKGGNDPEGGKRWQKRKK